MVQAFLNQPSIEAAHEAYIDSFSKLPSVRASWNNRKPTLPQFKKRFGEQYDGRQKRLGRVEGTTILAEKDMDALQVLAEALRDSINKEPEIAEEVEAELVIEVDNSSLIERLAALLGHKAEELPSVEVVEIVEPQRTVKPENEDKTPSVPMMFKIIHQAIRDGSTYAQIPVRRIDASYVISQIEAGKTLETAMRSWRQAVK